MLLWCLEPRKRAASGLQTDECYSKVFPSSTHRVHVLTWVCIRAENGSCVLTLGPLYVPHTYSEHLRQVYTTARRGHEIDTVQQQGNQFLDSINSTFCIVPTATITQLRRSIRSSREASMAVSQPRYGFEVLRGPKHSITIRDPASWF